MNKVRFLYKFYINKQYGGRFNWNLLFPFAGVIIGCVTVALTLAIMEGMEYSIFNKLQDITFPAKITHISKDSYDEVGNYLFDHDIDYHRGVEGQVIIMNDDSFSLITIHGIDKFDRFSESILRNKMVEIEIDSNFPLIYLGRQVSIKLDISLGDTIQVIAPNNINIFTGLPLSHKMIVGGIFEYKILDYDQKHVFTNYNASLDLLPNLGPLYYIREMPSKEISINIKNQFPNLQFHTWEEEHYSFISAMKLEKIIYSLIGFLIVGIGSFTLMSMMSLSVIQKVPQIGILKSMGANKKNISLIFICQALITWFVSAFIGIIISLIIIQLDKHYHLIQIIFPSSIFFEFPLILKGSFILIIICVSLVLLLIAAIYPAKKAANLDATQAIGFRR